MLQIKLTATLVALAFLLSAVVPVVAGDDARGVDWLLKDAYEEEYVPLSQVAIALPQEVRAALDSYHSGDFRKTVEILERLRDLRLPDGRLDFVTFVLAEAYRQLGCEDLARRDYGYVIANFSLSDKLAPSYYRLLEYAMKNDDPERADSICSLFQTRFASHPLSNSVDYLAALLHYQRSEYDKAILRLSRIAPTSSRGDQARFLTALCYLQTKDVQKALIILDAVHKGAADPEIAAEAAITIGDIYYQQNNVETALRYYQGIPAGARRFTYALMKTARAEIDLKQYDAAVKIAQPFIKQNQNNQYYFEMASILEQALTKLGKEQDAAEVSRLINRQVVEARITFEIFDEVDRVTDMQKAWQRIEHDAIRSNRPPLVDMSRTNTKQLQDLEKRYYSLLREVAPNGSENRKEIPFQAERRYMGLLKTQIARYDDTLIDLHSRIGGKSAQNRKSAADSLLSRTTDSLAARADTLVAKREKLSHEHDLVLRECIGNDPKSRGGDEELQAKFLDWAFLKYQDKKEELKRINLQLAERKKLAKKLKDAAPRPADSAARKGAAVAPVKAGDGKQYTENDRERLIKQIVQDRDRLVNHTKTIIDVYPKSKYNPQVMLRMAELYFDEAGDRFQEKLKAYELKMAQGKDTAGLEFPEYQLDKVIKAYDDIIDWYPHGDVTDAAYFYKALALQKIGKDSVANIVLLKLCAKFPESGYYVESNMNIGKYYFDHPKVDNGRGYKLAEEAYRRVLFFRDHPEYVSALYHLGWCYYMQDRYEEAIAVFKYLIEETHLEFDPSKMDEKQVTNPLLRGEAIDYIAISFDAENKIENAIQFLKLVGNIDYAAMVLKRIGELREEDLDYQMAIKVYRRLLAEYPNSRDAPATYVSLIRLYESHDKADSAMALREEFFTKYSKNSQWQKALSGSDSSLTKAIDSMAISNGLYVADAVYRRAEVTKNRDEYSKAAASYQKLVESYSGDPRAAEALWNLAVILDVKLLDKPQAFDRYTAFSKLTFIDSTRREQAALNAVAIAQGLLPPDSAVQKGTVDFAAAKVVEAVNNYCTLFPNGGSWGKVMLGLGAIYFNRHLYSNAAKIYEQIAGRGAQKPEYFEALSFLGQCHYGEENWPAAVTAFEKVYKESKDAGQRAAAGKLLLQSEFLNAKKFMGAGEFANAAELFRSIDEKYPGSEYGDVALFNAAGAHEKLQQWDKACDRYADLVKRYPSSKLAADALFNSAEAFEKADKYDNAADVYEQLAANYPYSEKAKDALFNVGFCYEKLGKPDKMADANERYSARYPGEKDVEAMLLRSGAFYAKASMWERAISVYRNFIRHYPRSPKAIEAYFMIAKCYYDQGEKENAMLVFAQTEQQNMALAKDNLQTDNYHAAEAAYYTGLLKRDKFLAVKLTLPQDKMKQLLKEKSDLLADAAKGFQRVMQYRSERMFEAAYRVGQLYEDLSSAWKDQERPSLDPIKAAVLDKEIQTLASGLLQKTFIPYQKALALAKEFDSLGAEQKTWVAKSESSLKKNLVEAGALLKEAVSSMSSAPVPAEIRDKPLHLFQYLKQLQAALAPMKEQVRQYYTTILATVDSMGLTGEEVETCRKEFAQSNWAIGEGYDKLATMILKNSKELSKDLPQDQKEDLVFQMEDIVYEVQDKAIFSYEDGLKVLKKRSMESSEWYRKIVESLARLSPDKYGSSYYRRVTTLSGGAWAVRADSAARWNTADPPLDGWQLADTSLPAQAPELAPGRPHFVGEAAGAQHIYLWKNVFLGGTPRNAGIYMITPGVYRLFLNGALVLSDTVGNRDIRKIDSATGITAMLKGGDNVIAAEIKMPETMHAGAAIAFAAMVDTTEHFTSSIKIPAVLEGIKTSEPAPSAPAPKAEGSNERKPGRGENRKPAAGQEAKPATQKAGEPSFVSQYRNHGEMMMAIDNYVKREQQLNQDIKKERVSIQLVQAQCDSVEGRNRLVKEEIQKLKAEIASMSRGKDGAPVKDSAAAPAPEKKPAPDKPSPAAPKAPDSGAASPKTDKAVPDSVKTERPSGNPDPGKKEGTPPDTVRTGSVSPAAGSVDSGAVNKKAPPVDSSAKPAAHPKSKGTF
jgi:cellulose synthase operon protein C